MSAAVTTPAGVHLGTWESGVPIGLCACGCGQATRVATKTRTRLGHVKGQPQRYLHNHHLPKGSVAKDHRLRLAAQVAMHGPDDCWPFMGGLNKGGYGKFTILGRTIGAHRVAYEIAYGAIPDGLLIRHRCDNPPCCNPAHLVPGTVQQNSDDMVQRGRSVRGPRSVTAKLTEADAVRIRELAALGLRHRDIAAQFGVSRSNIQAIASGRNWGWVK